MYFFIEHKNQFYTPRFLTSHRFTAEPGGRNPRHAHPVYHILLFESGKGRAILGARTVEVGKGSLLLISPDVEHQFIANHLKPHIYRQVTFDLIDRFGKPVFFPFSSLFSWLGEPIEGDHFTFDDKTLKRARGLIAPFIPFGNYPAATRAFQRESERMLISLLCGLLALLSGGQGISTQKENKGGLSDRVNDYLKGHYAEPLRLRTISDAVGLSPFHLSRRFKAEQGKTIFSVLNDYRLKVAANLLKHSHYSTKEIALKTGFCDVFYLSKVFKKKFGIPPRAYQRDLKSEDWMVSNTIAKPNLG